MQQVGGGRHLAMIGEGGSRTPFTPERRGERCTVRVQVALSCYPSWGRGGGCITTLVVWVIVLKREGRAPPPSLRWLDFTHTSECTPEGGDRRSFNT